MSWDLKGTWLCTVGHPQLVSVPPRGDPESKSPSLFCRETTGPGSFLAPALPESQTFLSPSPTGHQLCPAPPPANLLSTAEPLGLLLAMGPDHKDPTLIPPSVVLPLNWEICFLLRHELLPNRPSTLLPSALRGSPQLPFRSLQLTRARPCLLASPSRRADALAGRQRLQRNGARCRGHRQGLEFVPIGPQCQTPSWEQDHGSYQHSTFSG
ncbi:hypothetical protein KIL84_005230 [Mauremys mutica]|uniref:Uncharacterized protein n=1 Tax=Mauremys mutica TaxID=74926 RepID=A0A9D3XJ33_9SAUR|nr:hypothetical protein KIL84_005230 [Mauremys mutica]